MLDRIRKIMDKTLPVIAALFLLVGVSATVIGVADRTFGLNLKTVWAEEVTRYTIIWCAMLLMGIGFRMGTQTRLTLLSERLPEKARKVFEVIVYLLVILMFGILMIYGFKSAIVNRTQLSAVMQISMFWPYLSVPVGSLFVVIETIGLIYETITGKEGER